MSNHAHDSRDAQEPDMTFGQASRLLQLALDDDVSPTPQPVQRLASRLREQDGERWFASALAMLDQFHVRPMDTLLGPTAPTADDLRPLKSASAALAAEAGDDDRFLAGTLGYFLTISAGLAYHNTLLSSRSKEQVTEALLELVEAIPEAWQQLVRTALSSP